MCLIGLFYTNKMSTCTYELNYTARAFNSGEKFTSVESSFE